MNWNVSKEDQKRIEDIANRAVALFRQEGVNYPLQDAMMDITATHANGCPLDLAGLAGAPLFDFIHDVGGIRKHLNRETGTLENHFLPRFAERRISR